MVEITAFILESKSCKGFFFLQMNFPPMRALQFITDHVIFKLCFNQIYQMKNPQQAQINQNLRFCLIKGVHHKILL